jgi:hypothetical protein
MDLAPLALIGILTLWAALGFLAWTAATVIRRARHPLAALPLCLAAGMGAGALVPALGRKDGLGLGLSLLTALAGAVLAAVIAARVSRFG